MARKYSSIAEAKTLTANVASNATQITLSNVTGLPSRPYVLVLNPDTANEEAVLVTADQTGVTSPTLKVTRAIETGASAKTHTNGDIVKHMIVGSDLELVHDHIDLTTNVHGYTATATEINILDGATLSTAELNVLDGITATTTELNYVDGVTSFIQTQLNSKAPLASPTFTGTVTLPTGTVTSGMILDGTIVNADINSSAAITASKLTGTTAEFNTALSDNDFATLAGTETLTNKTLTSPKINENVAVTATATELNILDGLTASTAELNILDGVTASTAELNHVVGVTGPIQTQFTNQTTALTTHAGVTGSVHGIADTTKLAKFGSAAAGRTIFVQTTTPTALATGDIWIDY
jgi:hypothetical protein